MLGPLPIEDPVRIVAVAVLVFLVVPLLLRRFDLPGTVGIVLVGAAIGPHGIGLLERDATVVLLGTVGINYLMFLAGLEIDVTDVEANPLPSLRFGALSFGLPFALGVGLGILLLDFDPPVAVLYAAAFASHTLLAYPTLERLDLVDRPSITTAVSGTLFTDTLALLALTVVVRSARGSLSLPFWGGLAIGGGALLLGTLVAVPRIATWFFRSVEEESYFEFLFALAVLFLSAAAADLVGLEAIIGSFLAGIGLNRLIPATGPLMDRLQFVGNALLIPFFLLSVGMLVDPRVFLASPVVWAIGLVGVGALLVGKLIAAWVEGAIASTPREGRLTAFGLTVGQAAATLAIALLAFEQGLFDERIVNGIVLLIVTTSVLSPAITDRFGRRLVDAMESGEDEPTADRRVLVPLPDEASEAESEALLDVAFLLRGDGGETPLYALAVAHRETQEAPPVERSEVRLERAAEYASEASVPTTRLSSIAFATDDAVVRAVAEYRITTVLLPWGGEWDDPVLPARSLLQRTDVQVIAARVADPVNAVDEVHAVLPGEVPSTRGLLDGIALVKRLAKSLDVPLRVTVVGGDGDRYRRLLESTRPDRPFDVSRVERFDGIALDGEDAALRIVLTPRPGAGGWDGDVRSLTRRLARVDRGVGLVVYLPSPSGGAGGRVFRIE
ncbi:MAG: cation:proton antiporter [Halanaeroarchaeum sp.]